MKKVLEQGFTVLGFGGLLILRTTTPQPNDPATWGIPPLSWGFLGDKKYQLRRDRTEKR